jgi:hypothetical protein
MFDPNDDVTRLTRAAYEMRNRVIADLLRSGVRKLADAVKRAAPGLRHNHAA